MTCFEGTEKQRKIDESSDSSIYFLLCVWSALMWWPRFLYSQWVSNPPRKQQTHQNREKAQLKLFFNTHCFLLHSIALSIRNSGRQMKPSAFSSWTQKQKKSLSIINTAQLGWMDGWMEFCSISEFGLPHRNTHTHSSSQPEGRRSVFAYILIGVPVQVGVFENKPVLLPFLCEIAGGVFLLP